MRQLALIAFIACLVSLCSMTISRAAEPILVEFFYYEPCSTCPSEQEQREIHEHNSAVVTNIENDYGSEIQVTRVYFYHPSVPREEYNLSDPSGRNAIVINREYVVTGYADEAFIRNTIDFLLQTSSTHNVTILNVVLSSRSVEADGAVDINVTVRNVGDFTESFNTTAYYSSKTIDTVFVVNLTSGSEFSTVFHWDTQSIADGNYTVTIQVTSAQNEIVIFNNLLNAGTVEVETQYRSWGLLPLLALAFSFGFFETFSPCLIVLLSFVLSYAMGETNRFRESFLKVIVFGLGFLLAALLLGLAFGVVFLSLPTLTLALTLGVSVFAILLGLNLLGVLKFPIETKPTIQKLAKKHVVTFMGLFFIGFVFYFLDPCIAPIFVAMVPLLYLEYLPLILLIFSIGALIPFIAIGASAGSISKLVRSAYKNKTKLRAISGFILIGYAVYLISTTLIL